MAHGIYVFGASGSGTTTLGRELAQVLSFTHLDVDDYFWENTDVPFTISRPRKQRQQMLEGDMVKHEKFVVSGSATGWDEPLCPYYDLAIFITTPTDIRIERLKKREYAEFGERIVENGDMQRNHFEFLEWAANYDAGGLDMRSLASHEQWIEKCPCPIIRINGADDYRSTAKTIAERFYTKSDELWRVKTYPLGELEKYRFTVIFARNGNSDCDWLYVRHKKRDTWETAGGHIEKSETPLDCAKRELIEETGAEKFSIKPVFDYAVHRLSEFSYGQVFLADIETRGNFPQESEMREVKKFETIPDEMTYPQILPRLFDELQKYV